MTQEVLTTNLPELKLLNRGKVRDIYDVDERHLLIVTTDRISAFDVIMNQGIPGKGSLLTDISNVWFAKTGHIVPNHIVETDVAKMPAPIQRYADQLAGRTILVRKATIFPVECVVRGYVVGSGWKDYQKTGAICGIGLPKGLQQAAKLDEPIFTPATKADVGEHDENISFERMVEIIGAETATTLRALSIQLYTFGRDYAEERGIILADTKFEFGLIDGRIHICDEVLTPDSSRFWDASEYRQGISPPSFDKQILRDWLETQPWNKKAPAPDLPEDIRMRTRQRYEEVIQRLKS